MHMPVSAYPPWQYATRHLMEAAGLPTPRHFKITSAADLEPAAHHVGFPAVIKPVSGAASIGVIRVNDQADLEAAFKRCGLCACVRARV